MVSRVGPNGRPRGCDQDASLGWGDRDERKAQRMQQQHASSSGSRAAPGLRLRELLVQAQNLWGGEWNPIGLNRGYPVQPSSGSSPERSST
eukprot:scaffold30465_cov67-Phaeocystis_antarctica.AAC.2